MSCCVVVFQCLPHHLLPAFALYHCPRAPVPDRPVPVIPRTFPLALLRTQVPVNPIAFPADPVARAGPKTPPELRILPFSSPGPVRLLARTSLACAGGRRRVSAVARALGARFLPKFHSVLVSSIFFPRPIPLDFKISGPPLLPSSLLS